MTPPCLQVGSHGSANRRCWCRPPNEPEDRVRLRVRVRVRVSSVGNEPEDGSMAPEQPMLF